MTRRLIAAILVFGFTLCVAPAFAHRLDEYLQGTIFSIGKSRIEAQMTLTPGIAVFPRLIATIDTNADGIVSDAERNAYATQVLRDLSVSLDPDIRIAAQNRNYSQSLYDLDYEQSSAPAIGLLWIGPVLVLLSAWLTVNYRSSQLARARTFPPSPSHRT